jgi:tRNA pseudouridine55 synthase
MGRKRDDSGLSGVLNIDKPSGMTSHDVVDAVRRAAKMRKVGHTGTLDPMATGVLPLCVGQATRIAQYMIAEDKAYRVKMRMGLVTDSQDITGAVLEDNDPGTLDEELIKQAVESFIGGQEQIPPMVSAKRVDGKRLYELAREGVEIEREPCQITVHSIELHGIEGREVEFTVACSKGTYIRTLCHDMGRKLGCGAATSGLIRTRCGAFNIDGSVPLDKLDSRESVEKHLCSMADALGSMPSVTLDSRQLGPMKNGRPATGGGILRWQGEFTMGATVRMLDDEGRLVGIGKALISSGNMERLGGNLHVIQPIRVLLNN